MATQPVIRQNSAPMPQTTSHMVSRRDRYNPDEILEGEINQPFFKYFENETIPPHKEDVPTDDKWIHLGFLLDRSGSMMTFKTNGIIDSINNFVKDQMEGKDDHKFSVTIVSFDNAVRVVFDEFINTIEDLKITVRDIHPRGSTALVEANAFAIEYIGRKCASWGTLEGDTRPSKIIFATMTDGEENSSEDDWHGKSGQEKLSEVVKEHTDKWGWKFFFLGANIDSRATGSIMGYNVDQCIDFHTSNEGYDLAFSSCSRAIHENRGFSQEERTSSMNPF